MNFKEALEKLAALQHRHAVYEELIAHLEQFLPSDVAGPELMLEVEDCSDATVDFSVIEGVQNKLIADQKDISKEMSALQELKVTNGKAKK